MAKIIVVDEVTAKDIKTNALAKQPGQAASDECARRRRRVRQEFRIVRAQSCATSRCCRLSGLNVYDILRRDTLVLTKAAVKAIEERLA